ncbi:hypothetical protein GW916_01190 [bacterium]|nr:hypothetical protein [bacterium]
MLNSGFPITTLLLSTVLSTMLFTACTGAVDSDQIRKGNSSAPDKYKVSENCKSASGEECKVIISYPNKENGSK